MKEIVIQKKNKCQFLKILHAKEDEKKIISGLLMNEINQNLVSLKLKIDLIESKGSRKINSLKNLSQVKIILDNSIARIREISMALYPYILDDLGLINAIKSLFYEFEKKTKSKIIFNRPSIQLDIADEIILYRLIQEVLLMFYSSQEPIFINFEIIQEDAKVLIKFSQLLPSDKIKNIHSNGKNVVNDRFNKVKETINLLDGNFKIIATKRNQFQLNISIPAKR